MLFLRRLAFASWMIGSMIATFPIAIFSRGFTRWCMARLWAPVLLGTAGAKVKLVRAGTQGPWPLPEDAKVILVGNHASHLDIPILSKAFGWAPRFVAKLELGKIPLLAYYIRRTGSVLIDRAKTRSAARSLDQAVEAAHTGAPLAFFAEGTRSADGAVAPFRNGAFAPSCRWCRGRSSVRTAASPRGSDCRPRATSRWWWATRSSRRRRGRPPPLRSWCAPRSARCTLRTAGPDCVAFEAYRA